LAIDQRLTQGRQTTIDFCSHTGITDIRMNANANLGGAWNDKKQYTAAGKEEDSYLGTEVNLSLNYKLYPTLTATLQGAYVMLGDFYDKKGGNGKDPDDPYLTGLMLNYTF